MSTLTIQRSNKSTKSTMTRNHPNKHNLQEDTTLADCAPLLKGINNKIKGHQKEKQQQSSPLPPVGNTRKLAEYWASFKGSNNSSSTRSVIENKPTTTTLNTLNTMMTTVGSNEKNKTPVAASSPCMPRSWSSTSVAFSEFSDDEDCNLNYLDPWAPCPPPASGLGVECTSSWDLGSKGATTNPTAATAKGTTPATGQSTTRNLAEHLHFSIPTELMPASSWSNLTVTTPTTPASSWSNLTATPPTTQEEKEEYEGEEGKKSQNQLPSLLSPSQPPSKNDRSTLRIDNITPASDAAAGASILGVAASPLPPKSPASNPSTQASSKQKLRCKDSAGVASAAAQVILSAKQGARKRSSNLRSAPSILGSSDRNRRHYSGTPSQPKTQQPRYKKPDLFSGSFVVASPK